MTTSNKFCPYLDTTAYPTPDLSNISKLSGVKYFTLGFVVSKNNKPSWGGYYNTDTGFFKDQIISIRTLGGDVIVSFGGAAGAELAITITNMSDLVKSYQSVIDQYSLTYIDFDIEGSAITDKVSVDRRSQAIAILQKSNPNLKISFCLPVLPTGLTSDGIYVLNSLVKNNCNIDCIQIMTFDYGEESAPTNVGISQSQYAIKSANSVLKQVTMSGLKSTIGIIPMIGVNDINTEIFNLPDAHTLVEWAKTAAWVSRLSFWSINRDVANKTQQTTSSSTSSGIIQTSYAFSKIFNTYLQQNKTQKSCLR